MTERSSTGDYVAEPTDEDYAKAARAALQAKQFPLAVQQAAAAVAMRPLHAPHTALLDEIIATAKGPLALLKIDKGAFFGLCAARARALVRFDRVGEALDCLFQAASFRPETPFLPWAVDWVTTARHARAVDAGAFAGWILVFLDAVAHAPGEPGLTENLEAAAAITDRLLAAQPEAAELVVILSRILRALGKPEEALARLGAGDPDRWDIAVERAAIHGTLGDEDARIAWLERALAARPSDAATLLDLGDAELARGDAAAAITRYAAAEATGGSSRALAAAHLAYARALAWGHDVPIEVPTDMLPELCRVVASLEGDLAAYVSRLAEPMDPIIRVLRGAGSRAATEGAPANIVVRVKAERPLAPSAREAFRLRLRRLGKEGDLVVTTDAAPAPLAAYPSSEGPAEVRREVLALASEPFAWDAWCKRARAAAETLGEMASAASLGAVLRAPGDPAAGQDTVLWVHGVQVAAALILGAAGGPEPLVPLLAEVDDWTSVAAVLGLRAVATIHPESRARVIERLLALVPRPSAPLPIFSRALAVTLGEVLEGDARRPALALRARVRKELLASRD